MEKRGVFFEKVSIPGDPQVPGVVRLYGIVVKVIGVLGMIGAVAAAGNLIIRYHVPAVAGLFAGGLYFLLPFVLFRMGKGLQAGERNAIYGMCVLGVVSLLVSLGIMGRIQLLGLSALVVTLLLYGPPIVSAFRHWNCFQSGKRKVS